MTESSIALWNRASTSNRFMSVRLGIGEVPVCVSVKAPELNPLQGANKKLMIIGILIQSEGIPHDYIGVTYPEGFTDTEHMYAFDHTDIDKVEFIGYKDAEFQLFRGTLCESLERK